MKKRWLVVALLMAAAIAAIVIGGRELEWTWGTLGQQGPFPGEPYTGPVPEDPTSRVQVTPDVVAETFEHPETKGSILRLTRGNSSWSCLLLGRLSGVPDDIPIRNARLRGARTWDSGHKLLYEAEWDVSGSESGTMYLNPDMTLNHFTMR